jgi:hypothetical protein
MLNVFSFIPWDTALAFSYSCTQPREVPIVKILLIWRTESSFLYEVTSTNSQPLY